jgi:hypothetical protein
MNAHGKRYSTDEKPKPRLLERATELHKKGRAAVARVAEASTENEPSDDEAPPGQQIYVNMVNVAKITQHEHDLAWLARVNLALTNLPKLPAGFNYVQIDGGANIVLAMSRQAREKGTLLDSPPQAVAGIGPSITSEGTLSLTCDLLTSDGTMDAISFDTEALVAPSSSPLQQDVMAESVVLDKLPCKIVKSSMTGDSSYEITFSNSSKTVTLHAAHGVYFIAVRWRQPTANVAKNMEVGTLKERLHVAQNMEMGTLKERLKPVSVSMTSRATSPIPQASFDTLNKPYSHPAVEVHTPAIRVHTVPIALRMQLEAFEDTPPDRRDRVLPTKATLGEPFALEACKEPFAPRTAETIEIVPPHEDGGATPETPVVNLAALEKQIPTGALAENLLWAARSGLDHNKLQGFLNAFASTPNVRISKSAAIIVDSDKHRLISRMRRKPVRQETPGARKASEPGSTWILDGWGPVETGSIENGCYYEWSAACEAIGYELDAQCRDHGHDTVFAFLRHIAAFCAAHNRTWRILRVDAAMRTESFKAQVEAEFGVLVEVAPGGHHEGVALKEATNDINTRASEQMLARAAKGSSYVLPAKRYARHIRNASPPSGSTQSRHHLMTGKPLDLASSPTPLIFGCDIAVLNDEAIRDQKGSGKANRASEGEFIGIDGAAYIIRKFNGQIVRRKNVQPLNESVMMVSGLPGGAVSMNEETQTEGENLGSLPPLAPPPAPIPKPAPTLKPKVLNVNVGDRIEAYYLPWTRGNKRKPAELHEQGEFHAGTITAFRDLDSGSRHHLVMWEGDWKGMGDWLDLANEVRLWRPEPAVAKGHKFYPKQPRAPASPKAASPKAASKPPPKARPQRAYAAPTADAPRTRARARNYAKIAMVNAVNTFVTEAFRTLGPEHRESFAEQFFECDADDLFVKGTLCTLTRRAQRIIARTAELPDDPTSEHVLICNVARKSKPASSPAMANKADGAVEIVSETGEKTVLRPPANERARQQLPDAELWIPAFDKARDVLAHAPGNHWMTMSEAKAKGYAITPGVLTNKYKQDPVTGKLEVNNGRKSRIAFDNPRFESIAAKRGESDDTGYGAPVASILQRNITLADACERQRGLTKADVGNAFLLGLRGATMAGETTGARTLKVVIVRMPEGCRLFDPDTGEELVLVCVSPIWGERAAGFEWHMRLLTLLDDAGWQPCPEVPCMFYKTLTCGHDGRLITIVDDLLFSEANMRHDMAEKTVEFLRKQVGKVTIEIEPTFYAGVVIERTFDKVNGHDTLSLSMAEKIHAGTLDVAPQLVRGEAPPLAGKKLVKALHELKPLPVDDRKPKLTKQDRLVGSINGKVQWYKQILPGLSWMQHRLACVIAAPPPTAFDIAVSVLALAYAQREKRVTYTRGLKSSESLLKGAMSATIDPTSSACSDTVTIADTSWGVDIEGPFTSGDVYGLTMTRTGAHVYTTTHKLGAVVDCSAHAEAIGTGKAGEITEEARAIERGLGVPPQKPTLILTDNRANALVGSGQGTLRSRHAIRRYVTFMQRVQTGAVTLRFLPDKENPADILTKPVPHAKAEASLNWMMGTGKPS